METKTETGKSWKTKTITEKQKLKNRKQLTEKPLWVNIIKALCKCEAVNIYVVVVVQATIREAGVAALRAALVITSQREGKQKENPTYYKVVLVSYFSINV